MTQEHWLYSKRVEEAVKDRRPLFMIRVDQFNAKWHQIIDNHNMCIGAHSFQHNRYLNSTIISHAILHPEMDYFNAVGNTLKDTYGYDSVTCHLYTSFTVDAEVYGYHKDSVDVFIVGLIGLTEYLVEDTYYDVAPGNVLFVPKGVMHGATPKMPRSIVSIGLGNDLQNTQQ